MSMSPASVSATPTRMPPTSGTTAMASAPSCGSAAMPATRLSAGASAARKTAAQTVKTGISGSVHHQIEVLLERTGSASLHARSPTGRLCALGDQGRQRGVVAVADHLQNAQREL